ncbi:cytochrome P450 [Archangium violaceum]|uniref:cytochrome P450 n=1 Tax=Archangium violaceum TaxID=83451 RepID=UPI00193B94FE|nr:cytochrome P450 [Archangium violaceum]QRK05989.1 cytochrome P450 [Archangium violaceum]
MLPPGPALPSPLQMSLYMADPLSFLRKQRKRHGDTFTLRMSGMGEFVFVSAPEDIKRIFNAPPDALHAGEGNAVILPLVGSSSLVMQDGAEHIRLRRLLLPPFQGERLHTYAGPMRETTHASLEQWPVGKPFPLLPRMMSLTIEILLRSVFGIEGKEELALFARRFPRLVDSIASPLYLIPALSGVDVFQKVPWLRASKMKREVDEAIYALIAHRRAQPADPRRQDMLSLLLESRDEAGQPLTDRELRDALFTVIVAGYETTAIGMCFTVERLLSTPEALARVHEELERVVGDTELQAEHLGQLEYLDAVIKETLRLRPVVPLVSRRTKVPFELSTYTLPPETMLVPGIALTHLREDIYPEPDSFQPERFLGKKPDPYAWLPFGGGSRRCLGMALSLFEMKVVLATMLRRAKLRLASKRPIHMVRRSIMFAPSRGMPVVLDEVRPRFGQPQKQVA